MLRTHAFAMTAVFLTGIAAEAQQPTPPPGPHPTPPGMKAMDRRELGIGLQPGPFALFHLLKNAVIVEELEFTDEQKRKFKEAERKQQETFDSMSKEFDRKLKEARDQGHTDEMMILGRTNSETIKRLNKDFDETVTRKILDPRQAARLKEIQYQADGPIVFDRPDVQEKLGLEPDQIQEIQRIIAANREEFRAAAYIPSNLVRPVAGAEETPETKAYSVAIEGTRKNVAKIRVSSMKAIEQVLTKAQRGTYKKMVGEPFQFYKPKEEKSEKDQGDKAKKNESAAK